MRATDSVRDCLIAMKLEHWYKLATLPGSNISTVRNARRNYWKLVRKYPKIAKRGGWTEQKILLNVA
jgi:hypothetical protein